MSKVIIKGLETDEEQDIANDLMAKVHFPGYYTAYSEMGAFLSNRAIRLTQVPTICSVSIGVTFVRIEY